MSDGSRARLTGEKIADVLSGLEHDRQIEPRRGLAVKWGLQRRGDEPARSTAANRLAPAPPRFRWRPRLWGGVSGKNKVLLPPTVFRIFCSRIVREAVATDCLNRLSALWWRTGGNPSVGQIGRASCREREE